MPLKWGPHDSQDSMLARALSCTPYARSHKSDSDIRPQTSSCSRHWASSSDGPLESDFSHLLRPMRQGSTLPSSLASTSLDPPTDPTNKPPRVFRPPSSPTRSRTVMEPSGVVEATSHSPPPRLSTSPTRPLLLKTPRLPPPERQSTRSRETGRLSCLLMQTPPCRRRTS